MIMTIARPNAAFFPQAGVNIAPPHPTRQEQTASRCPGADIAQLIWSRGVHRRQPNQNSTRQEGHAQRTVVQQ